MIQQDNTGMTENSCQK